MDNLCATGCANVDMPQFTGDCGVDNQVSPVDNLLWRKLLADRVPLRSQILGGVAQSAEQAAHNRCVTGSSPVSATQSGSVEALM